MNKFTRKALIVAGTLIGVVALFLIIVFIPVGDSDITYVDNENVVEENVETDTDGMSKKELEERVKELEAENAQLKDDVERYKILAEQTTKAVEAPKVIVQDTSSSKDNSDSDDEEDKDTDTDKKPSASKPSSNGNTDSSSQKPSTNSSSSNQSSGSNNSSNTSDTGL